MNKALVLIASTGVMLLSSCTGSRVASSTEYDDVYYSSSDAPEVIAVENTTPVNRAQDDDRYAYDADRFRRPVDNYYDEYYAEDDFYFSRRVRRFNNAPTGSWRYYDPFFTNDLYFVMGTPSWNAWNNNGWYNWNYPRFGATFGWNNFGGFNGFYDPWMASSFNRWNNFNYFNPWVNAYYGYDPFFAPGWGNPYAFGFNNGFNAGFGTGFGNAYWCPPYGANAFFGAPSVAGFTRDVNRRATYRRPNTSGTSAQTTYTPESSRPKSTRNTASNNATTSARPTTQSSARATTSDNSRYLRPQTSTERATRPTVPSTYSRPSGTTTTQSSRTAVRSSGATSPRTTTTQSTTRQPRVYTQPSRATTTRTQSQSVERNTRTSTPSYNSSPRRTYSAPSRSSTPTYNRSSTPSYNRSSTPSSSPARSSSSGSSRPSSSSSSSRPSSSRR